MKTYTWCGRCGKKLGHGELDFHDGCKTVPLPGQISFIKEIGMTKVVDEWNNCYPSQWGILITPDALGHPAKFSSKLIRKIYEHIVEEGWVKPSDCVIDPFGGVALGAIFAMQNGLSWRGCELEERFVKWGNENIALWDRKFHVMPKWSGDAKLFQGDSRMLAQVLDKAQQAVSSPPYAETRNAPGGANMDDIRLDYHGDGNYSIAVSSPPFSDTLSRDKLNAADRRELADEMGISNSEHVSPIDMEKIGKRSQEGYAAVVSSPPYADSINSANGIDVTKLSDGGAGPNSQANQVTRYGTEDAQLGAMKATDKGFQAAVSSPPYNKPFSQEHNGKRGGKRGTVPSEDGAFVRYGNTDGQLEGLPDGNFQQVVSSPPFLAQTGGKNVTATEGPLSDPAILKRHAAGNSGVSYGETEGNMGRETVDDFWTSARAIVEQVFMVLEPGGHATWVLKDYVKGGKRVEFCKQWQQMCEAVGFVTLHEHHATFTRNRGVSTTDMVSGEVVSKEKRSVSFFRRVAEKKGSLKIDYEVVMCMQKPMV